MDTVKLGREHDKNRKTWYLFLFDYDIEISAYRDEKNISGLKNISRLKHKNFDCESSQKFHGNKIRPVFSASGSEKQKPTTSVRCQITKKLPHEFSTVHGACTNGAITCASQLSIGHLLWHFEGYMSVVISPKTIMREWTKKQKQLRYYRKSQYMFDDISWMQKILPTWSVPACCNPVLGTPNVRMHNEQGNGSATLLDAACYIRNWKRRDWATAIQEINGHESAQSLHSKK